MVRYPLDYYYLGAEHDLNDIKKHDLLIVLFYVQVTTQLYSDLTMGGITFAAALFSSFFVQSQIYTPMTGI